MLHLFEKKYQQKVRYFDQIHHLSLITLFQTWFKCVTNLFNYTIAKKKVNNKKGEFYYSVNYLGIIIANCVATICVEGLIKHSSYNCE